MKRRDFIKLALASVVAPAISYNPTIEPIEVATHIYIPPELEDKARKICSSPITSKEFIKRLDTTMKGVYERQYMELKYGNIRNQKRTNTR